MSEKSREILAQYQFNKPFSKLSPQEKEFIFKKEQRLINIMDRRIFPLG